VNFASAAAGSILSRVPPAAGKAGFPVLRGDAGLVEKALRETGADRSPAGPSVMSYAEALSEAIARGIGRFLSLHGDIWFGISQLISILFLLLVAVAIALLALAVWRRFRKVRPAEAPQSDLREREGGRADVWTAAEWREELERRLSQGDLRGALEAFWWWLARAIGGAEVEESWTSRQLLKSFRREDLTRDVARLDRMIYGETRPAAEEIRGLVSDVTRAVG